MRRLSDDVGFTQDLRYALRQLAKAPAFAAVAIVTLALGIGANTAIFSLLDQALLRTLPVKDADRLVILQSQGSFNGHTSSRMGGGDFSFSYPMYRDLRDQNTVFNGLIATDKVNLGVQWHNQPELVDAELVSGNYFDVLGVQPALGRLLVASDDVVVDANPVAVLSFSYWQRRYRSGPGHREPEHPDQRSSLHCPRRSAARLSQRGHGRHSQSVCAHDDERRDNSRNH